MKTLLNFWRRLVRRLKGQQPSAETEFVQKLMQMLLMTREDELACEAVYEMIDLYAEAMARGEDVARTMPLIEHHLAICGHCREEFEALMLMMQYERDMASS